MAKQQRARLSNLISNSVIMEAVLQTVRRRDNIADKMDPSNSFTLYD